VRSKKDEEIVLGRNRGKGWTSQLSYPIPIMYIINQDQKEIKNNSGRRNTRRKISNANILKQVRISRNGGH
jgi:hypothetical protein